MSRNSQRPMDEDDRLHAAAALRNPALTTRQREEIKRRIKLLGSQSNFEQGVWPPKPIRMYSVGFGIPPKKRNAFRTLSNKRRNRRHSTRRNKGRNRSKSMSRKSMRRKSMRRKSMRRKSMR